MNYLVLKEEIVPFTLKYSTRARRMRITIAPGGTLVVTVPNTMNENLMRSFLVSNTDWILTKIQYSKSLPERKERRDTQAEYLHYKEAARTLVQEKIATLSAVYAVTYKKISIKNQKTLWGSCSRTGNLSFNYKLAIIDEKYAEYIIVHELCHLREFNHSKRFWDLVAKTIPNHKEIRKKLKEKGYALL